MTCSFVLEYVTALVMEQPFFLVAAQRFVADGRPIARVGEINIRLGDHGENVRHVTFFSCRDPSIHHVEIKPSVVVIIKKFASPAPACIVRAGLTRDVRKGKIAVVMPEEISFAHVIIGNVGDVDIEKAIVIKVAPVGVHTFFGVKADGGLCLVREVAVAVIYIKSISAKIISDIQVFPAIVIGVSVPEIERPAGGVNADALCNVSKSAVAVVVKNNNATAIVGIFKTLRKKSGGAGMEDIDGLEIAPNEKIDIAI